MLHQTEGIPLLPLLDDFSAIDAVNGNTSDRYQLARWRDAHELSLMGSSSCPTGDPPRPLILLCYIFSLRDDRRKSPLHSQSLGPRSRSPSTDFSLVMKTTGLPFNTCIGRSARQVIHPMAELRVRRYLAFKRENLKMANQDKLADEVKRYGYAKTKKIKLYGKELELLSDPVNPEDDTVFVEAREDRTDNVRRVQVPRNVVQMAKASERKKVSESKRLFLLQSPRTHRA